MADFPDDLFPQSRQTNGYGIAQKRRCEKQRLFVYDSEQALSRRNG
jgi:hypothetical protein